jgi:hypothetical protein
MSNELGREQTYRTILPIEAIVAGQINRIMEFGSKKLTEYYEESIERLIDLLPPEIEESIIVFKKENNITYDMSVQGKERYVLLFREIKKQLNKCNIVWHRGSYAVGHD